MTKASQKRSSKPKTTRRKSIKCDFTICKEIATHGPKNQLPIFCKDHKLPESLESRHKYCR